MYGRRRCGWQGSNAFGQDLRDHQDLLNWLHNSHAKVQRRKEFATNYTNRHSFLLFSLLCSVVSVRDLHSQVNPVILAETLVIPREMRLREFEVESGGYIWENRV